MKKNLFLAALAFVALASCTSDEFVGENTSPTTSKTEGAIQFGSNASKITRATSNTGTVEVMLDGQFKVYGTKNVDNVYSSVFPNYVVWSSTTVTTSNPDGASGDATKGWEYVGPSNTTYGASNAVLGSEQTIKYWDHAATNYHFVAGSPVSSFTYTLDNGDIKSATVTGLAGHITANPTSGEGTALSTNPVYIANPVNILEVDYRKPVQFNFVRQQSRVRVGVFETIPGYKITQIKFYPYGDSDWDNTSVNNIILASKNAYFVGGSASATVTYNWSGTTEGVTYPNYTFDYGSGLTPVKNWYAGELNASGWEMAITSTERTIEKFYGTDKDIDTETGYFTVIPTPSGSAAQPLLIKCDYILSSESDGSGETITIHGATAAIPAAFSKWAPNTSYTYLFKISDNTNGVTSTSHTDKVGLFPITFDAVAVSEVDGLNVGTVTTVTIPSITTYQEGSVVDVVDNNNSENTKHGIEYKTGTNIYLTVQNNTTGELAQLADGGDAVGAVQVYYLGTEKKTEAEMQYQNFSSATDLFTLKNQATTVTMTVDSDTYNIITLPANQHGFFYPENVGYYVIQYLTTAAVADPATPAAYTYKVVYVGATGSGSGS